MKRQLENEDGRTLWELWVGIVFFAVICELIGIWFVPERLSYSMGIVLGAMCSCIMATHMHWSLAKGLSLESEAAVSYIRKQGILRYVAVTIVMIIVMLLHKFINPLSWFLALMGLKASAYLQPFFHRLLLGKEGILKEQELEKQLLLEYEERLASEDEEEEES